MGGTGDSRASRGRAAQGARSARPRRRPAGRVGVRETQEGVRLPRVTPWWGPHSGRPGRRGRVAEAPAARGGRGFKRAKSVAQAFLVKTALAAARGASGRPGPANGVEAVASAAGPGPRWPWRQGSGVERTEGPCSGRWAGSTRRGLADPVRTPAHGRRTPRATPGPSGKPSCAFWLSPVPCGHVQTWAGQILRPLIYGGCVALAEGSRTDDPECISHIRRLCWPSSSQQPVPAPAPSGRGGRR